MTETKIDHLPTLHVGDILTFSGTRDMTPMAQTAVTTYKILEIYLGKSYPAIKIMVRLTITHSLHGNAATPFDGEVSLDDIFNSVLTVVQQEGVVTLTRDK